MNEGDSVINLINQTKEIEIHQDLYSKNGKFFNSFTFSNIIFHNTSDQSTAIMQISSEYQDYNKQWDFISY